MAAQGIGDQINAMLTQQQAVAKLREFTPRSSHPGRDLRQKGRRSTFREVDMLRMVELLPKGASHASTHFD
ncbi:hypothetical protein, partial [Salmonella enterica]|uniref:hypothetical protein n=1 Tax=Salmonella enterica TaxID=28901 RepID=UPI00398C2F21